MVELVNAQNLLNATCVFQPQPRQPRTVQFVAEPSGLPSSTYLNLSKMKRGDLIHLKLSSFSELPAEQTNM